jgi:succinate-semialdehyde dehydrogenase/glutarate-semialdehyde dehydrogenase
MSFDSINPATDEHLQSFPVWDSKHLDETLLQVATATAEWSTTTIAERRRLLTAIAGLLRQRKEALARLITLEMGKLYTESQAEIEKCALACDYYAKHGADFLAAEIIESDAGYSCVRHEPLGTVLAIMPWNFPFWQVFRFAAPALTAGNTAVLKHAANVPQCAQAIEQLFTDAGFPANVFRTLMIRSDQVRQVIEDRRVHAVTLTGSEPAGRQVAAHAGAALKKSVLELGGSDAFIVLEDADLDLAVHTATASRFMNAGQSCIAAKRFIIVEPIADEFRERFHAAIAALQCGDPFDPATTLAPMARNDLRSELQQQVQASIGAGAEKVCGCQPRPGPGAWYEASLLDRVTRDMPAFHEELFGPVASLIRVRDETEAVDTANASRFGLGGSLWSADSERAERLARQLQSGAVFINGLVKSDPRLPFGGVKASGYGRELSYYGMYEFVNHKTVWRR